MTTKKKTTSASSKAKAGTKQAEGTRASRSRKGATAVADAAVSQATPSVISVTIAPPQPEMAPIAAQGATQAPVASVPTAAGNAQKPLTIGMFQKRLHELGYYGGHWDGIYGPLTRDAVCRFQAHSNLPVNGDATPETIRRMGLVG